VGWAGVGTVQGGETTSIGDLLWNHSLGRKPRWQGPSKPSEQEFSFVSFVNSSYNGDMEVSFRPELEAKLNQIASQAGKGASQVVEELVANYLDHDQWFRQEVGKGIASLDHGKSIPHDEVGRQMERILNSR